MKKIIYIGLPVSGCLSNCEDFLDTELHAKHHNFPLTLDDARNHSRGLAR